MHLPPSVLIWIVLSDIFQLAASVVILATTIRESFWIRTAASFSAVWVTACLVLFFFERDQMLLGYAAFGLIVAGFLYSIGIIRKERWFAPK